MNAQRQNSFTCTPAMAMGRIFALFALVSALASGQEASDIAAAERPPIQFQILKAWKVDLGDHSIFLNRVAPPVLPQRPAVAAQPAPPLSAEDLQIARQRKGKKSEVLFLSATVYDRTFTEIRWMDSRHESKAISNVDFNLIPCTATFESADTVYSLLLAVDNKTTPANAVTTVNAPRAVTPPAASKSFPSLEKLSPTRVQYLILEDDSGALPEENDLNALDALHAFYDAHRQPLAEDYAKREAARMLEESKPKAPPPKPPDIIVNFWDEDGELAGTTERKEAQR